MLLSLVVALVIGTPQRLQSAGERVYHALRDFQRVELVAYKAAVKGRGTWPTLEQHQQITARLAQASEGIWDSFALGLDVEPGQPIPPQVVSFLRAINTSIASLYGLVGPNAPAEIRKLMNTIQDRFATLWTFFPAAGEYFEHPPRYD